MNKVVEFLKCTGNDLPDEIDRDEFFKQVSRLFPLLKEEVAELEDALIAKDVVEIVDALSDIRVYMDQLNYLQDKAGIDRVGVNEAVDLNNSLKWTTDFDLAFKWFGEPEHLYTLCANYWINEDGDEETTYCLKDTNGKVRKYGNFPKVELTDFIPESLLEVKPYVWDSTVGTTDFDQLLDETSDS